MIRKVNTCFLVHMIMKVLYIFFKIIKAWLKVYDEPFFENTPKRDPIQILKTQNPDNSFTRKLKKLEQNLQNEKASRIQSARRKLKDFMEVDQFSYFSNY